MSRAWRWVPIQPQPPTLAPARRSPICCRKRWRPDARRPSSAIRNRAPGPSSDARPARVLLGQHEGAISGITPPSSINYLAVRMKRSERWRYQPPEGHTVLWVAIGAGTVAVPDQIHSGELAAFEPSNAAVEFKAQSD